MKKRQQRHAVMKIGAVTRGLTSRNTADLRTSPGMRGSLDGGLENEASPIRCSSFVRGPVHVDSSRGARLLWLHGSACSKGDR
ncbi:hypothetical protein NL676_029687 [Syzygium grande]|nr:hypothetical protein NL676_029687 [Syzygium grande]